MDLEGIEANIPYRLGRLEASMENVGKRMDDSLKNIRDDINRNHLDMLTEVAEVKLDLNKTKEDVAVLQKWKTEFTTKITTFTVIASGAWILFGEFLKGLFR